MKIKNINGTLRNVCSCGSWLKHWKNYSGQKIPDSCPVKDCKEKVSDGAHVQKANVEDDKWYICPLCKAHNKSTEELSVPEDFKLVSANKKETCERTTDKLCKSIARAILSGKKRD